MLRQQFISIVFEEMSLSELESLPNEILADLLEKYIRAFNYQLNQRFDQIIARSHRMRFNCIGCRMDDFRFCMGLLPAYIHKIEELAISDRETPGQVHAFLSFHPSFIEFRRLWKIYIHFSPKNINWNLFQRAIYCFQHTFPDSVSIETEEGLPDSAGWHVSSGKNWWKSQ